MRQRKNIGDLVEVILDLGRNAEARFPIEQIPLSEIEVSRNEISHVVQQVGHFGDDNRAGIERTLHRLSLIHI